MTNISQMVYNAWNLAKPSRYVVYIPSAIKSHAREKKDRIAANEVLWLNCKNINIPSVSFTELTHAYSGQYPIDIPTAKTFSKMSGEFYLSENHYERNFFLEWTQDIFNETDVSFNFPDEYKRDITIYQLAKNSNKIKDATCVFKILDAYPKSVGDVLLSYSEVNSVGEFQVGFAFTKLMVLTNQDGLIHGSRANDIPIVSKAVGNTTLDYRKDLVKEAKANSGNIK